LIAPLFRQHNLSAIADLGCGNFNTGSHRGHRQKLQRGGYRAAGD
jgi:hypothetical protein